MATTIAALVALIVAGPGPSAADECSRLERWLSGCLERAQVEKEPEGTLASVFEQATAALPNCPDAEGLAYLRVRTAELGRGALLGLPRPNGLSELRGLTAEAASRFPQSVRILTAKARVWRDVAVARRALAADPHYVPARVVLADILLDQGNWREAEKVLADRRGLDATSDGLVVFARIALEGGNPTLALARVRQALTGGQFSLIEPDARDPRPVMRAHAIAGRAALALNRFHDAAVHLRQASPEDPLVRDVLRSPSPQLARALRALERTGQGGRVR